jgi:hypothetical protein
MKKSMSCAKPTAITPKIGPRNAPATGPKNWKSVKNWFSAPMRGEKLILLPTNAKAVKRAINATRFTVNMPFIFIIITVPD